MPNAPTGTSDGFVLIRGQGGFTAIPASRPLTRLNYFDGKFLRASDLQGEQAYERLLVALANQAGGGGVVHGFDATRPGGDKLLIGPGLAIDFEGHPLLLPQEVAVDVGALIQLSSTPDGTPGSGSDSIGSAAFGDCVMAATTAPSAVIQGTDFYLITIGLAQAYCGEEDVFGKLCDDACVTGTERPYIVEGVVIRAVPLAAIGPLITSSAVTLTQTHLRSQVASAYFAKEATKVGSLISRAGLGSDAWCLGARPTGGREVPIALLARAGTTTLFVDAWTARRERIEPPPRQYWAWRMAMRPWAVFLAQVLQFQCQLRDLFGDGGTSVDLDPCNDVRTAARAASDALANLIAYHAAVSTRLAQLNLLSNIGPLPEITQGAAGLKSLQDSLGAAGVPVFPGAANRVLIRGGIVELPSAGYLPVVAKSPQTVNDQVRRLLGEGLDLRFCIVRPDYVPHALEESQHMERISLLQGLDDPSNMPRVDILVPDGQILDRPSAAPGRLFRGAVRLGALAGPNIAAVGGQVPELQGVGRSDLLDSGGASIDFAGASASNVLQGFTRFVSELIAVGPRFLSTLQPTTKATPPVATPGVRVVDAALFRNLATASTSADRHLVELGLAAPAGQRSFGLAENSPVAAIVVTARCEGNPFALKPGETTAVSLEVLSALPNTGFSLADLNVAGNFRLDQASNGPGGLIAKGRLRLLVGNQQHGGSNPGAPATALPELNAVLSFARAADGSSTGQLDLSQIPVLKAASPPVYRIAVTWGPDSPLQVKGTIDVIAFERGSARFADADFVEDSGVIQPAEAHHVLASRAIKVIAASLNDPKFADDTERRLFPPAPPQKSGLEVLAQRDWVLFRRRREATCALDTPPPPPPAARQYRVYQAVLDDPAAFAPFRKQLLSGGKMVDWTLTPVDVASYPGGLGSLGTDPDAFRTDWTAAVPRPGDTVGVAAIGTAPGSAASADGDNLALARLNSLLAALAPIEDVSIAVGAGPDLLTRIATDLDLTGVDGVIVIATADKPVVKVECQSVYWLNPFPNPDVPALLKNRDLVKLTAEPAAGARRISFKLGPVNFQEGTTTISGDTSMVKAMWSKLSQDGQPKTALVFSASDAAGSAPAALHADRARAIGTLLGHDVTASQLAIQAMPPGDCPVITLITPSTTCHRVFALLPQTPDFVKKIGEFLKAGQLARLMAFVKPVELGVALLVPGTDNVIDHDLKTLAAVFQRPPGPAQISVWTHKGDARVEPAAARLAQAAILATIVGSAQAAAATLIETGDDLNIDCPHLTLLVLPPLG